ncbi:MAG TPA: hypothetical protein DEG92_07600 [Rikenellaceae bacterium]|nr:hypothetical protein [Rikenellaceae bacterium]
MKKIIHFTGMQSFKFGSLERYFLHLIQQCSDEGYKTILQYETMPSSQSYLDELKKSGAEVMVFPTYGNPWRMFINCLSCLREIKANIVHTHFTGRNAKLVIPIIARMCGTRRIICMVHNKPPYQKKNIARFAYNLYHHVLPVSKSVESSLLTGGVKPDILNAHYLGLFGEKVRSKEDRVLFRKKFSIPGEAVVLICISFDAPFKGVDILVEAFQILYSKHKNIYLLSVGVDVGESRLPALATELGISDRVRWAGIVDEGWKTLSAADIYVQPSRSEEGLPLAIMEAMAMKLPIVCTNISGNVEAVADGKNGLICKPTKEDLAAAIEKMILRPDSWREMGEAGKGRFLELFDGKKSVEDLIGRYYL